MLSFLGVFWIQMPVWFGVAGPGSTRLGISARSTASPRRLRRTVPRCCCQAQSSSISQSSCSKATGFSRSAKTTIKTPAGLGRPTWLPWLLAGWEGLDVQKAIRSPVWWGREAGEQKSVRLGVVVVASERLIILRGSEITTHTDPNTRGVIAIERDQKQSLRRGG